MKLRAFFNESIYSEIDKNCNIMTLTLFITLANSNGEELYPASIIGSVPCLVPDGAVCSRLGEELGEDLANRLVRA